MKTRKDVEDLMTRVFAELQATREAGQKEYAHDDQNALANFERTAADCGVSREAVLWIFAMKHKDGIAAWIKGHRSQREDVRGRIKDLIVYLILLWAMVDDSEPQAQERMMVTSAPLGSLGVFHGGTPRSLL